MLVREMSRAECEELLARLSFGRLACARDNQPNTLHRYASLPITATSMVLPRWARRSHGCA